MWFEHDEEKHTPKIDVSEYHCYQFCEVEENQLNSVYK